MSGTIKRCVKSYPKNVLTYAKGTPKAAAYGEKKAEQYLGRIGAPIGGLVGTVVGLGMAVTSPIWGAVATLQKDEDGNRCGKPKHWLDRQDEPVTPRREPFADSWNG